METEDDIFVFHLCLRQSKEDFFHGIVCNLCFCVHWLIFVKITLN